jgi:hypothetical protein
MPAVKGARPAGMKNLSKERPFMKELECQGARATVPPGGEARLYVRPGCLTLPRPA